MIGINEYEFEDIIFDYSYNSEGKLTTILYDYGINEFIYDGNLIVENIHHQDDIIFGSYEYYYNNSEQLISDIYYREGEQNCETTYIYNGQGNITSLNYSCTGNITLMTYDDNPNPYKPVYTPALYKVYVKSNNNIVFSTNKGSDFDVLYLYEYNSQGYPTKSFSYFDGDMVWSTAYQYEKNKTTPFPP